MVVALFLFAIAILLLVILILVTVIVLLLVITWHYAQVILFRGFDRYRELLEPKDVATVEAKAFEVYGCKRFRCYMIQDGLGFVGLGSKFIGLRVWVLLGA